MQAIERSSTSIGALAKAARSGAMLSQAEEQDLARLAQQGNQRAFERLVHAHIPLVFAIASEFRSYGLPAEELMSEGLLGLVKAARGFDPERGTRLASYAAWWIRAYLRSYTISNRRIVRGPSTRNARKTMAWLRRTERELARSTGGPPDLDAVARVLGVKTSDVEEARAILGKRDLPYGTAGEDGYVELAAETSSPEAIVSKAEDQRVSLELVSHALSRLDPRARRILQQRHLGQTPSSLAALSEEFGISRERVRQLEVRAKADVRSAIRSRQARSGALSRVA